MLLFSIGCILLLGFDIGRAVVFHAHLVGFSLGSFVEDCSARCVVDTCVYDQLWSSGDGMWLFPTLVYIVAGHSVVLLGASMRSMDRCEALSKT